MITDGIIIQRIRIQIRSTIHEISQSDPDQSNTVWVGARICRILGAESSIVRSGSVKLLFSEKAGELVVISLVSYSMDGFVYFC